MSKGESVMSEKLPSADAIAIELCSLLGINSNEIEDVQLPSYGRNRWELIAEAIRADRRAVLEAAAECAPASGSARDHGKPRGHIQYHHGWNDACRYIEAEIRKKEEL